MDENPMGGSWNTAEELERNDSDGLGSTDVEAGNAQHDAEDAEEHHEHNIFKVPASTKARVFWLISFPPMLLFSFTVPDCRKNCFKSWYIGTFGMSIVWMGILVEVMVSEPIDRDRCSVDFTAVVG